MTVLFLCYFQRDNIIISKRDGEKPRSDLPPSPAWDEKSCDGLNHGEKLSAFGVTMMVFSIYLVKL